MPTAIRDTAQLISRTVHTITSHRANVLHQQNFLANNLAQPSSVIYQSEEQHWILITDQLMDSITKYIPYTAPPSTKVALAQQHTGGGKKITA
jgi:hypothetical protein